MTAAVLEGDAKVAEGEIESGLACMDEATRRRLRRRAGAPRRDHVRLLPALRRLWPSARLRPRLPVVPARRGPVRAPQHLERALGHALLVRRDPDRAWALRRGGARSWSRPSRATARRSLPNHRARALAWLADLRFRQGRLDEAKRLIDAGCPGARAARDRRGHRPRAGAWRRRRRARLGVSAAGRPRAGRHAGGCARDPRARRDPERPRGASARAAGRAGCADGAGGDLHRSQVRPWSRGRQSTSSAETSSRLASRWPTPSSSSSGTRRRTRPRSPASSSRACSTAAGRAEDGRTSRALGEQRLRELRAVDGAPALLTARELAVLQLVAEGLSNPEIGRRLVISTHTVHRHVSNIMRKLAAGSRAAAVARAAQLGLF